MKDNINREVGYIFLNKNRALDLRAIFKLKRFIKKNNITIIHAHSSSYFIAVCVKLLLPRIKIVWHDHFGNSDFLSKRKKFPISIFSNLFSVIISVNNKLYSWSKKYLYTKNVYFLRNFPVLNEKEKRTTLKGKINYRIVHVAGYRSQKDHINLLRAFKIINEKYQDWTLHLVGQDYQNEYSKEIKKFITNNNLERFVFEYGVCSDIFNILDQSTIGVLSSNSEGLPISLLEYGLARLPIVTTNVGECNLVINDERFIVEPLNSAKLAHAIELLISSEALRKGQIKINYEKVISQFSKESFIYNLITIYRSHC